MNDEPFPQHFTVMIHCFYNTLCTVYVFLSYLFWLEESRCVIFLCRVGHVTLYLMALERNGEITQGTKSCLCRFGSSIDSELKCN